MNAVRSSKPFIAIALVVIAIIAAYLSRAHWWPASKPAVTTSTDVKHDDSSTPSNKIIVGDQAQKNLGLTAKPLQAGVFWKTITVPGMIVDRPGFSDREVVAPAVGTISRL